MPYDHAMTVVPQYSSAPLLVAYRGALARPEYQTVLAFDPTLLCTMTKGSTGIAGTLSIQVNGGEWSGSGVCCAATMAAF